MEKFTEEERFSNTVGRKDSRKDVFKYAKQIKVEDSDIFGDSAF